MLFPNRHILRRWGLGHQHHHMNFYFFYFLKFLFTYYFCLYWVFIAACGPSPVAASGVSSSLRHAGLSTGWLLLLRSQAPGARAPGDAARGLSSCSSRAPERRPSSCGARAQSLRGMRDPPGPGLEPVSPASAGGLPTTAPPGKPHHMNFGRTQFSP